MIAAKKAREIAFSWDRECYCIEDVEQDILRAAKIGLCNHSVDVYEGQVGKFVQALRDKGYKVYANITPYKETREVEIEW